MPKGGKLDNETFRSVLNNGYQKNSKQKQNLNGGFTRDDSLSGNRVQVYHNNETGKTIVNHRGTKGIHDVVTDGMYSVGLLKKTKRYKHSNKIQKQANEKYGRDNILTTGHSLGSVIAQDVSGKGEVITFNKPVALHDRNKKIRDNQTDVRTKKDLISILRPLQKGNKATTLKSTTNNFLTEHSTNSLQREDDERIYGTGIKQPSRWIIHVKQFALKHNISYKDAMTAARASYKK